MWTVSDQLFCCRSRDAGGILDKPVRSWTSTQNLAINVTSNNDHCKETKHKTLILDLKIKFLLSI
jgi:hypothetical protein